MAPGRRGAGQLLPLLLAACCGAALAAALAAPGGDSSGAGLGGEWTTRLRTGDVVTTREAHG
jgi:hypothetical protein